MNTQHTLFVCTTCASIWQQGKRVGESGGQQLLKELHHLAQDWELRDKVPIQEVECMSACNRSCVIAFVAAGKTTYLFGDLPVDGSASAVLECASQYYAKPDGLLPWSERPEPLKKEFWHGFHPAEEHGASGKDWVHPRRCTNSLEKGQGRQGRQGGQGGQGGQEKYICKKWDAPQRFCGTKQMRPENSVWQGNFGYWQNGFIHANLLVIGYYAWNGFVESGRGIVSVDVEDKAIASSTTSLDLVQFNAQFIAKQHLAGQMQAHRFDQESIARLLPVVDNYNPQLDVILLLTANARPEINLLQNLKITPPECEQQVRRRWEEFQPCLR